MAYRDLDVQHLEYDEKDKPVVSTDKIEGIGLLGSRRISDMQTNA